MAYRDLRKAFGWGHRVQMPAREGYNGGGRTGEVTAFGGR